MKDKRKHKFKDKLYSAVERVMRGEKKQRWSIFSIFLRGFLYFLSLGYQVALWSKQWFYQSGLLQAEKVPIKVISIGNLAVGGRGKTPLALFLLEHFLKADKKVAISTRGYRSQIEKSGQSVALDLEKQPLPAFEEIGDEALLFARRIQKLKNQPAFLDVLAKASVIVGKNRYKSALLAKKLKAGILILDDGFQYRKLFQDIKILMIKKSDFSAQTKFLPRGVLRDLPQRVNEADFIMVEEKDLAFALNTFPERKVVAFQNSFSAFKTLQGKTVEQNKFTGKAIKSAVFCAIGDPERFISALEKTSLEIVKKTFFLDHLPIKQDFLEKFAIEAQALGSEFLICTEKDAVKLFTSSEPDSSDLNFKKNQLSLPIYYPELELKIVFGQSNLEKALRINLASAIIDKAIIDKK